MKRILLVLLSVFLFIIQSAGQENDDTSLSILFKGAVMDAATLKPLPNTQILINRIYSSVSGTGGEFAFYVKVNDTLLFSNLGYVNTSLIISDTLRGREYMAGIYMESDTLSIGEVVIIPRNANLKSEILNSRSKTSPEIDNARYNVAVSAYQGKNTTGKLGDPSSNYEMLRQRQKTVAFERGGIPSDRILGLSPFMLIPAAYLLLNGLPEKPPPLKQDLTDYELLQLNQIYRNRNNP